MSVNKVYLLGNVGAEPKIHTMQDGTVCAQFSVATTERGFKMSNGTEVPERTEWHNVVAWRKIAGVVERFVHKGTKIHIEGKLKTRKYKDKSGADRYTTEIHVENLELLGASPLNGSPEPQTVANDSHPISTENNAGSAFSQQISPNVGPAPDMGGGDDDLPF